MQRQESESGFYHLFARGVGRMLLFEDDIDRRRFLAMLFRYGAQSPEVHAWCLMPNHYHLLVRGGLEEISMLMARTNTRYAMHFNERHGHVGHVFQGRYGCQPIGSERQLLATIRYIHRNPPEGGICTSCDYPWSSYSMYLRLIRGSESSALPEHVSPERAMVLERLPNTEAFVAFHADKDDQDGFGFLDDGSPPLRSKTHPMPDEAAIRVAAGILGDEWRLTLPQLSQEQRDAALRQLRTAGLSIRQIERLTGIGRRIVASV